MQYLLLLMLSINSPTQTHVVIVQGTPGTPEYETTFGEWSSRIEEAAVKAGAKVTVIGNDKSEKVAVKNIADRDHLQQTLASIKSEGLQAEKLKPTEKQVVWLVMIGHGTFAGKKAKFNLRGRDVSSEELSDWLQGVPGTIAIVNCSSSSAPFINQLAHPNRIVVTATKSGAELNYSRFGDFFSTALTSPAADLDKDEQTSLLEAFLFASKGVQEFYITEDRLATEHAVIDDNGDGKGTPSTWFRGVRVNRKSKGNLIPDGLRANQIHLIASPWELRLDEPARKQRAALELELEKLRQRKSTMSEAAYLTELEERMRPLSEWYKKVSKSP